MLLSCILLSSCSTVLERAHDQRSESTLCLPSFPDKNGWYGGDGAYSIKLDDRRVLWLFGDTFVSDQEGRKDRMDMKMVLGTTLAISICTADAAFQIRYYLKKKNGEFVSSFDEKEWLWPQDPFIVDGILYVPLISVKANPKIQGPFKFEIAGHKIAKIKNFEESDPNRWIIDYLDLTPGLPKGIKAFATTSVVFRGFVYYYPLYSATKDGASVLGNILARMPTNKLDDPARAIEYLTKDGGWEKELDPAKVKVVFDAAVSEMSVRYHSDTGEWVAVYLSIGNNGDRLLYRTADVLEGPWTEPKALIESIPEVDRGSPRYDKNNFCYAGKEHQEFAQRRKLVVTYVCNSYDAFEENTSFIRKNLFLYRPVVKNPGY
ncbi:MAG: DUF4185 domain-containing protein [Syntrophales bacterium]